jgi:hypothetical protein
MRHAIPSIREPAHELTSRVQHEQDGHRKPHLQMLSLLASGQARSRQDVA